MNTSSFSSSESASSPSVTKDSASSPSVPEDSNSASSPSVPEDGLDTVLGRRELSVSVLGRREVKENMWIVLKIVGKEKSELKCELVDC